MTRSVQLLAIVTVIASTLSLAPANDAKASKPKDALSWYVTGDSYSAGEGVPNNAGACAHSDQAWGLQAVDELRTQGWTVELGPFTACTGHLVGDHYVRRENTRGKGSFWEWAREQSPGNTLAVPLFDVVTMTFGGNDAKFADILIDCMNGLALDWSVSSFINTRNEIVFDDCDVSEAELNKRVDSMASATRFTIDKANQTGGFRADVTGGLTTFYETFVKRHLTDRGRLVVFGYPRLFAPSGEWGLWQGTRCHGVTRGDANMLGRATERFDDAIRQQVDLANERFGSKRVVYRSMVDLFGGREGDRSGLGGRHDLCGDGDDWLNGVAFTPHRNTASSKGTVPRKEGSFHPNADGHKAMANEAARAIGDLDWSHSLRGWSGTVDCALALRATKTMSNDDREYLANLGGPLVGRHPESKDGLVFVGLPDDSDSGDVHYAHWLPGGGELEIDSNDSTDFSTEKYPVRLRMTDWNEIACERNVDRLPGRETGRLAFTHPEWGRVEFVTTQGPGDLDGHLFVVDASGNLLWRSDALGNAESIEPNNPPIDSRGHLFINFNPGRYNGVIVLRPRRGGFDDFETLPTETYNTRFYFAEVVDTDRDGAFEITVSDNDCTPDCAGGTTTSATYRWNGSDYVST